MSRHGRTGGEDPFHRWQLNIGVFAERGYGVPQCRRTKRLVCLVLVHRVNDVGWVHLRRACRVHFGEDGRCPHRRIEQREQRKPRNVDGARLNAEVIANLLRLFNEDAVTIKHALGRTGAAGREDDRRRVLPPHVQRPERL